MADKLLDQEEQWASIAGGWQSRDESPRVDPGALRIAVMKETRRMRWWLILELMLSATAVAVAVSYAAMAPGPRALFFLVDTFAIVAIVWSFALWGRRGLWRPAADTSQAYVALARRRVRLKLWTTWLALVLVAGQLAVISLLQLSIGKYQLGAAAAWLAWVFWMQRRARRELQFYDVLETSLSPRDALS